mmetsp:Transcript_48636/g.128643  ORF Transcript_48636/g.128643 Transcript_48636/m.128643 type:complete len:550 (-) Transcript_48636:72-1721(-)
MLAEDVTFLRLQTVVVALTGFAEGVATTQIFSYCPRLVTVTDGPHSVAFHAGVLYCGNGLGLICATQLWANAGNRWGCHRCLYVSLFLTAICVGCCSRTGSLPMLVVLHCMRGLCNGILILGRVGLHRTHLKRGADDTGAFGWLGAAGAASSMAGPAMGGITYDAIPTLQYPWTLPYLCAAALLAVAGAAVFFFMEDTTDLHVADRVVAIENHLDVGGQVAASSGAGNDKEAAGVGGQGQTAPAENEEPRIERDEGQGETACGARPLLATRAPGTPDTTDDASATSSETLVPNRARAPCTHFGGALRGPAGPRRSQVDSFSLGMIVLVAGGHASVFMGWDMLYPVFASIPEDAGGLDWTPVQIGATFAAASGVLVLVCAVGFPLLVKRLGVVPACVTCWTPAAALIPLFPRVVQLLLDQGWGRHSTAVVVTNYAGQLGFSLLLGTGFVAAQMIVLDFAQGQPGADALMATATGWLTMAQGLGVGFAPLMMGSVSTLAQEAEANGSKLVSRNLPFDVLGGGIVLLCVAPLLLLPADAVPDLRSARAKGGV